MASAALKVLVYGPTGSQASPVVWKLLEAGHTQGVFTRNPERRAKHRAAFEPAVEPTHV